MGDGEEDDLPEWNISFKFHRSPSPVHGCDSPGYDFRVNCVTHLSKWGCKATPIKYGSSSPTRMLHVPLVEHLNQEASQRLRFYETIPESVLLCIIAYPELTEVTELTH